MKSRMFGLLLLVSVISWLCGAQPVLVAKLPDRASPIFLVSGDLFVFKTQSTSGSVYVSDGTPAGTFPVLKNISFQVRICGIYEDKLIYLPVKEPFSNREEQLKMVNIAGGEPVLLTTYNSTSSSGQPHAVVFSHYVVFLSVVSVSASNTFSYITLFDLDTNTTTRLTNATTEVDEDPTFTPTLLGLIFPFGGSLYVLSEYGIITQKLDGFAGASVAQYKSKVVISLRQPSRSIAYSITPTTKVLLFNISGSIESYVTVTRNGVVLFLQHPDRRWSLFHVEEFNNLTLMQSYPSSWQFFSELAYHDEQTGLLYFFPYRNDTVTLSVTDGTNEGTRHLLDLQNNYQLPTVAVAANGKIYFSLWSELGPYFLYYTDSEGVVYRVPVVSNLLAGMAYAPTIQTIFFFANDGGLLFSLIAE